MLQRLPLLTALLLSACNPASDFQGIAPEDYAVRYPKENRVETLYDARVLYFAPGSARLSMEAAESLQLFLSGVMPDGVETANITLPAANDARGRAVARELRKAGISGSAIRYTVNPAQEYGDDSAFLEITHTVAVTPDCPDWRQSSVTNYSNTLAANMRCASVTNLGRMVADPRDLALGTGDRSHRASRHSLETQRYLIGADAPAQSAGSATSGEASTTASAPQ